MKILLDIETTLDHKTIWCCVTKEIETGVVKVWKSPEGLQDYLKGNTLVAHGGINFDFPLLNKLWNTRILRKQAFDTLVLSRLLNPNRENGHSLAELSKSAGSFKIDFTDYDLVESDIESLYEYCIQDIEALHKVYDMLMAEKATHGFSDECVQLEMDVAAIIKKQETNGFMLDVAYANTLCSMLNTEVDKISEHMQLRWPPVINKRYHKTSGKPLADEVIRFNVGSRQQVAEKLIEAGWKPTKLTPGGNPAVDEETLSDCNIPEAKLVLRYLMLTKRVSQVEQWLEAVEADGRIRGRVNTLGAVTNRATHSKPNMAQIPNTSSEFGKECRSCFVVPKGSKLVGIDLSGIELRCLSHYMQDAEWQNELLNGDVHWKNTQAFGLVPMGTEKTDSQEHKNARNLSKTLCYSVLYGAGPEKVGNTVNGGAKEGKQLINNFLKNTPALDKLKKKVEKLAESGMIHALDGRKIHIRSSHAALNSLLQSAGAIIAKQWILEADKELRAAKIPYKQVAWIHDELQYEVESGYEDQLGTIVVEAAKKAGEVLNFRCPVDAEYRTGGSWYDCH
jgi:DNA polymerase I